MDHRGERFHALGEDAEIGDAGVFSDLMELLDDLRLSSEQYVGGIEQVIQEDLVVQCELGESEVANRTPRLSATLSLPELSLPG